MVQKCHAPDCDHNSRDDNCSFYKFPRTPQRKAKWMSAVDRGDKLPTKHSVLCTCHFPGGILGYNKKKTPTIFKRNPEYRHMFKDLKKYSRKKLASSFLSPIHESGSSDTSGILVAQNYTAASSSFPDSSLSLELGVSALDDTTSHLTDNPDDSGRAVPLHSSTPHISLFEKRVENQPPQHEEDRANRHGLKTTTPIRKRGQLSAVASPSKKPWKVSRFKSFGTQVSRAALGQVTDNSSQTDIVTTVEEGCQTSVIMFDNADAFATFGPNTEVFKYLINEGNQMKEKLHKTEQEKKDFHAECKTLSASVKELQGKVEELQGKVVASEEKYNKDLQNMTTKYCTTARHVIELEEQLDVEKNRLLYKSISSTDFKVRHFTGLPNAKIFQWLCSMFTTPLNYHHSWKTTVDRLSVEDQLFMTLMKLKLNFDFLDLATWFNVSHTTVANVFYTWLDALHKVIYAGAMREIPSRSKIQKSLPACFKDFKNVRMIIDCTEVGTETPGSMSLHNLLWSNYKHRNTLKGLVGVAPNGTVVYASSLYPGSTSDNCIVESSKILNLFEPGDVILADKGFKLTNILPVGVTVNVPPFLTTPKFTKTQVEKTRSIARARIHVERAIKRIKDYTILDFIPHNMVPHSTKVWQVCAALTNLMNPLIKEVEDTLKGIEENLDYDDIAEDVDVFTFN